jgi:ABC-2 type transport system ATP-binding protein
MNVVVTRQLTRKFGDLVAVDRLTLEVPAGGVVGFVGPNGSGKSTTIRMLLGLITPTAGQAEVLGEPVSRPSTFAHRVGALVEGPAFLPSLSGAANLRSLAALRGLPASRVAEVLEMVDLSTRGKDRVKNYSMGMKQRLAVAAALLPDPEFLVLDEPVNGLDPAGMAEVRELLRRLGEEGRTVLVSSHLLSEIEAVCGWLVVIRLGELMFSGPLSDLMAQAGEHIDLSSEHQSDLQRLAELYAGHGWKAELQNGGLMVHAPQQAAADLNRVASEAGIVLKSLRPSRDSLESVFLRMTTGATGKDGGETQRETASTRQQVRSPAKDQTGREVI